MKHEDKVSTQANREQNEVRTQSPPSRLLNPLYILIVAGALVALFWTKLQPGANYLATPATLPEGFSDCHADHFTSILDLVGTHRSSITAVPVHGFDGSVPAPGYPDNRKSKPFFGPDMTNLSFCRVTYSYTYPGYNTPSPINVTVLLPSQNAWNGRFQGSGGGGYLISMGQFSLSPGVANGWAVATTDGGLYKQGDPRTGDITRWALTPDGNIDYNLLHVFGIRAIEDMTLIGQTITKQYYGESTSGHRIRSYWNGCSTGGRQGLMLAQRAPDLYDGILATAPALDYSPLLLGMAHPQKIMYNQNTFVQPCEMAYISRAAITACDPLDGVTDNLISAPELCDFDPRPLAGSEILCPGAPNNTTTISSFAAELALEMWRGPRIPTSPDVPLHPGLYHEATLAALANTVCDYTTNPPSCTPAPSGLTTSLLTVMLHLNRIGSSANTTPPPLLPDPAVHNLSDTLYYSLFHLGARDLTPIISATDPDLSIFATAPQQPKMITWHGGADQLISPTHTEEYYRAVLEHFDAHKPLYQQGAATTGKIASVQDFYRYYHVPGAMHCGMGPGPYPGSAWDSAGALDELVSWVEDGVVPETLRAVSDVRADIKGRDGDGRVRRPICSWPQRAVWEGDGKGGGVGEWWQVEGWVCK